MQNLKFIILSLIINKECLIKHDNKLISVYIFDDETKFSLFGYPLIIKQSGYYNYEYYQEQDIDKIVDIFKNSKVVIPKKKTGFRKNHIAFYSYTFQKFREYVKL